MKKTTLLLLATIISVSPIAFAYAHQDADMAKTEMRMMNDAKMEKMEKHVVKMKKHIAEMNSLLEAIKQESDQEKRKDMLDEHAMSMQEMMKMMHSKDMKNEGMSNSKKGMAHKNQMSQEMKIKMMERRLDMMETMMGQVMGHTAEKTKKEHDHKKVN